MKAAFNTRNTWSVRILATVLAALWGTTGSLAETQRHNIWLVGPDRLLKTPGQAARLAKSGDTVEIDAGLYQNDYAQWHQQDLTIRGSGGMAHLNSNQLIPNDKAIWIITGSNVSIENVEFSGAKVRSTNGAGIRHNGGNLTLRNTYFHHNEFSVLTGRNPAAEINISNSRFWYQRRASRFSHGIYIGTVKSFTLTGSHIKGTDLGHQVKSRAFENRILYNRIEDVEHGNSSRLIDLPNCGFSVVMGNDLQQGANTENTDVIGYGAEGCEERNAGQKQLFVLNNTLINAAGTGTLARNHVRASAHVVNNLFFGRGQFLSGRGENYSNVKLQLPRASYRSWQAPAGSAAIDSAVELSSGSFSTVPNKEFNPPVGTRPRPATGPLDVGSREARPHANPPQR